MSKNCTEELDAFFSFVSKDCKLGDINIKIYESPTSEQIKEYILEWAVKT